MSNLPPRVAILDRGDREARRKSAPEESRFLPLFRALADLGAQAERAVFDEAFADEVRMQLMRVKQQLEEEWVPALQQRFGIETRGLPVLWDCDFLLGRKTASGADTYVLCEINASSVSPFPESAIVPVARAAVESARLRTG